MDNPTYNATTGDFVSTTAPVYLNNIQAGCLNIFAISSTTQARTNQGDHGQSS
jgi:hypothetical protein